MLLIKFEHWCSCASKQTLVTILHTLLAVVHIALLQPSPLAGGGRGHISPCLWGPLHLTVAQCVAIYGIMCNYRHHNIQTLHDPAWVTTLSTTVGAIMHVCSGTSQIKINEACVPPQYPAQLTEQIIMASPQSSPSAANLNLGIPEGWCSAGWSADIQYCLMYGVHMCRVLV